MKNRKFGVNFGVTERLEPQGGWATIRTEVLAWSVGLEPIKNNLTLNINSQALIRITVFY